MSLVLIPRKENPWTIGTWRLTPEYPAELAKKFGSVALPAEQLYALAKHHGISTPEDPRLNSEPFPQRDGIYNAMARSVLTGRLKAAMEGFVDVYLVKG